jgi:hypothetical protein
MQFSRLFLLITTCFASSSAAFCAYGHESVPKDWCTEQGTSPDIIATFKFNQTELSEMIEKCGIVDRTKDDWHTANVIGQFYCQTQLPPELSEELPVMSFIDGPTSYLSKRHHSSYRLSDGLAGSCAVCIPPPTR